MTKNAENGSTREGAGTNLVSITPNLIVKNLQVSIAFYRERLGFQLDFQGPDDGPFWARVRRDAIGINFKEIGHEVLPCPNHTRHPWAPSDAYIYTLDPDTLFNEFRQRGVSFVKELSFIDEGLWGFGMNDADGYSLVFFQTSQQVGLRLTKPASDREMRRREPSSREFPSPKHAA